jgi:hypothetical protein
MKLTGSTTYTENVAPLPPSWLHHSGQYKYEYKKRMRRGLQTGLTSRELDDYNMTKLTDERKRALLG